MASGGSHSNPIDHYKHIFYSMLKKKKKKIRYFDLWRASNFLRIRGCYVKRKGLNHTHCRKFKVLSYTAEIMNFNYQLFYRWWIRICELFRHITEMIIKYLFCYISEDYKKEAILQFRILTRLQQHIKKTVNENTIHINIFAGLQK